MSLDLSLVSLVMYLQEEEINPGDEGKVIRFEKKMSDWRRDVVGGSKNLTREDMSSNMCWCEGVKCLCARTHWLLQESESFCWDCMHDPCACSTPLVWDATEQAYYLFLCRSRLGAWRQSIISREKRRERKERTKREKRKIAQTTKKVP
jgi:hypothetical protein